MTGWRRPAGRRGRVVQECDQVTIITSGGLILRTTCKDIRLMAR